VQQVWLPSAICKTTSARNTSKAKADLFYKLLAAHPAVKEIRYKGLLMAVELGDADKLHQTDTLGLGERICVGLVFVLRHSVPHLATFDHHDGGDSGGVWAYWGGARRDLGYLGVRTKSKIPNSKYQSFATTDSLNISVHLFCSVNLCVTFLYHGGI